MHVVGWNAKLLRDQDGNNIEYYTNSITLGGGESLDVILDTSMGNPTDTLQSRRSLLSLHPQSRPSGE